MCHWGERSESQMKKFRRHRFLSREKGKQLNEIRGEKCYRKRGFYFHQNLHLFYLAVRETKACHSTSSQITAQPVNTNWALDPMLRCFYFLFNTVSCIHVLIEVKLNDPSSYPLFYLPKLQKPKKNWCFYTAEGERLQTLLWSRIFLLMYRFSSSCLQQKYLVRTVFLWEILMCY